jgi:hypothetical protein
MRPSPDANHDREPVDGIEAADTAASQVAYSPALTWESYDLASFINRVRKTASDRNGGNAIDGRWSAIRVI